MQQLQKFESSPTGPKKAAKAVERLSGFFPRSAASNEEVFLAGLIEFLAKYPDWLLEKMVDVRGGLITKHKFMPSIAEVSEYCEAEMNAAWKAHLRWRETNQPRLPEPGPQTRLMRLKLKELEAKYGLNWGIKVDD